MLIDLFFQILLLLFIGTFIGFISFFPKKDKYEFDKEKFLNEIKENRR